MGVIVCCLAAGGFLQAPKSLSHPGKYPLPPPGKNAKSSMSSKNACCALTALTWPGPCRHLQSPPLLSSRPILETLPVWRLGRCCTGIIVFLPGIPISVWIHLVLLLLMWNNGICFPRYSVLYLCGSSPACFGNVAFMNTKESSAVVCYTYRREEGNCSTAAEVTPASSIDQKMMLWVKHATACGADNKQEGLELWEEL